MSDLESLASSVGGLFGLGGVMDDLTDLAILGGSAAAGLLLGNYVFENVEYLSRQSATVRAGIAIGAGVVLGLGVGKFVNRGVGAGLGAGLIGVGLANMVSGLIFKDGPASVAGSDLLMGLGDNRVIEPYNPLPGQVDGVTISELQPFPGAGYAGVDDNAPWLQ